MKILNHKLPQAHVKKVILYELGKKREQYCYIMVEFKVKNKDCSVSLEKECLVIEESLAKINSKLKTDLILYNEIFCFTLMTTVSFKSLVLFAMCKKTVKLKNTNAK